MMKHTYLMSIAAAFFVALVSLTPPLIAQQKNPDGALNPTASAVSEEQLFRQLDKVTGRISLPDRKAETLIQPEGRVWRVWHQSTIPDYGAAILLGMLGLLAVFYLLRGRMRVERGLSGIRVLRFTSFERFVHWFTSTCFIILALTGLNVVFGRTVLKPLIGDASFAAVTQYGKYLHNFLGTPFSVGILLMYVIWLWDNLPSAVDWTWIKAGGGFVGHNHPPAKKFNFGQKMIFWSVVTIGGAISISGYILLFPFYGTDVTTMQIAQVVHSMGGIVLMAIILAHIYIGSLGMEGAFSAMGDGTVDLNWAKEHHSLWAQKAEVVSDEHTPIGHPLPAE